VTKTIITVGGSFAGIKAAWDLRHLLDDTHRILLLSDQPRTTFRASFPRVLFENLDLEKITMHLAENFKDTGIEFICDPLVSVDQEHDEIVCQSGRRHFDYLILATSARHAYEVLPGSREFAYSVCDPGRILETREALLKFTGGEVFAGVGAGYTPCDGPPMEVLLDFDYHLRTMGIRDKTRLHLNQRQGMSSAAGRSTNLAIPGRPLRKTRDHRPSRGRARAVGREDAVFQ
jgi:sulfide:quinone oxidoreductase